MPWTGIEHTPKTWRIHQDANLTLAQINHLAEIYDGIKQGQGADDGQGNAAAMAWTAWEKVYRKEGDHWVKKIKESMGGGGMNKDKKRIESVNLSETVMATPFQEVRVDRETRMVRNVCLLACKSKNKRTYTDACMETAIPLFEGAKAFANHPTKTELRERDGVRDVREMIGRYSNVRKEESKLKGDLEVLEHQTSWVLPIAEQMPNQVGLSINAQGKIFRQDGEDIVEAITTVRSVDLVTDPATTLNLFEQINGKEEDKVEFGQLTVDVLQEKRPDLLESIKKPITEDLTKVTKERNGLKGEVDNFQVKEALQKKGELAKKLLEESKLPQEAITSTFMESLMAIQEKGEGDNKETVEAQMKKSILDREAVAFAESGKIKGMGDEKHNLQEKVKDEDVNKKLVEAVKLG